MRLRMAGLAVLAILAIAGLTFLSCAGLRCSMMRHSTHSQRDEAVSAEQTGWTTIAPVDGMTVYAKGEATDPPILLMHEIPGLIPETVRLGDQLVDRHYRVYMPLFFGKFGTRPIGTLRQLLVCAGPNFNCYSTSPSPVLRKLELLRNRIAETHKNQKMAIIGMCLTGGMPVGLVNKDVGAIVLSQPALPLPLTASLRRSLGVDVKPALGSDIPILAVHFEKDCLAPDERFTSLESIRGKRLVVHGIKTTNPKAHSVLTVEGQHSNDPEVKAAIQHVFDFIDDHLRR
jgi:dienelactone hydrolase